MKLNALISAAVYGAMCTAAYAAGAEDQPFLPVSDFSATVEAHNVEGSTVEAEVYHREQIFRVDAEMGGGGLIVIVDVPEQTQTIFMNMGGQRIATMVEWGQLAGVRPLIDQNPNEQPRLAGSDAVAGEPCDIYFVPDPQHAAGGVNVCFTHDGVPLRMDDAARGVVFEVTRFDRSAQDPALFVAPVGYQMMQMPGILSGAGAFSETCGSTQDRSGTPASFRFPDANGRFPPNRDFFAPISSPETGHSAQQMPSAAAARPMPGPTSSCLARVGSNSTRRTGSSPGRNLIRVATTRTPRPRQCR